MMTQPRRPKHARNATGGQYAPKTKPETNDEPVGLINTDTEIRQAVARNATTSAERLNGAQTVPGVGDRESKNPRNRKQDTRHREPALTSANANMGYRHPT